MELLSKIFSSAFLILSRRNIYIYMIGKIDLTPDELDKSQEYIEKIRPLQFSEHKSNLIRQIEQRKIPYLRDLSVDELDCLLESNIDLNGLLAVIYAKGGMLSAFGSISWNQNNKKYNKVSCWIRLVITLFAVIGCIIIPFLIYLVIVKAFPKIEIVRLTVSGIAYLGANLLPLLVIALTNNIGNKMRMLKREYPFIFEQE